MPWPWKSDEKIRAAEWEAWLKPTGVERPARGITAFITTNTTVCKPLTRERWESWRRELFGG